MNGYLISGEFEARMQRVEKRSLAVGIIALVLCLIGAMLDRRQFFRSYLFAYVFYLGVTLGCTAIVMLQYLSGGSWGVVVRRVGEASMRTIPLLVLLFIPVIIGIPWLYAWSHADVVANDPVLQWKRPYLNVPFFILRAGIYFAGWYMFALILNRWSHEHDRTGSAPLVRRLQLLSGPGLCFYGASVTLAAVDWLMSLDPHWYSTIFGMLVVAGQGLSALAFMILMLVVLSERGGPLESVIGPSHLHDVGKLLFAFVMLWAYFSFSQLLIIWAGNLTDEIPWYMERLQGGWQWIGLMLVLFHFALPFAMLLSRNVKRSGRTIAQIAVFLLVMRLVDLFWLVAPDFDKAHFRVSWMDFLTPIALGGIWLAVLLRELRKWPLLPLRDPHLEDAILHGGALETSY